MILGAKLGINKGCQNNGWVLYVVGDPQIAYIVGIKMLQKKVLS